MTVGNLYDAYFPLIFRALDAADSILTKGQAYAKENGIDPNAEYINAVLYEDMYPFVKQIQTMTRIIKLPITRTTGLAPEDWPFEEKTFAELSARVQRTRDLVKQVKPEQLNGRQEEIVDESIPGTEMKVSVGFWITSMLLPNMFFHVVTAYDILRMKGVPLGKEDYLKNFTV